MTLIKERHEGMRKCIIQISGEGQSRWREQPASAKTQRQERAPLVQRELRDLVTGGGGWGELGEGGRRQGHSAGIRSGRAVLAIERTLTFSLR